MVPRSARRLAALTLLAVLAIVTLSGCVRIQAGLRVSQDDLVTGDLLIAALASKPGDTGPVLTIVPELADKVRAEPYNQDGYVGQRLFLTELRFSDVALLAETITTGKQYRMSFRRSGDLVSMNGSIDLTQLPTDKAEVLVKIAFPGTINRTNGLNEDGLISWEPKSGAVTEFGVTAEYTDLSGGSWTRWVLIVGGSAIGVAVIVLALALFTHRRTRAQLATEGR